MSSVKVVELNASGRKSNLPPIVHTVRQLTKKQLAQLLQNLFNNTDDALFELADRSQSDQHQEMYFDSMRLIRLHRQTIASNFIKTFVDNFSETFAATGTDSEEQRGLVGAELADGEEFSLVDQEELEMTVAISGIVSKVTSQYSLPIMQLTKRLDSLAKTASITEKTNPLGPHALSQGFADALGVIDIPIKIRIILMKLFERFVMERLGPMFETANRALIEAGVLPDLKLRHSVPSGVSRKPTSGPSNALPVDSLPNVGDSGPSTGSGGPFGFATVQSLLQGARQSGGFASVAGPQGGGVGMGLGGPLGGIEGGQGGVSGSGGIGGATGAGGLGHGGGSGGMGAGVAGGGGAPQSNDGRLNIQLPTFAATELVSALSVLQADKQFTEIDIEQIPQLADLRTLVLKQADGKKSLGQNDDDTVNFVGMLFDYILNDRNLAIPMKALIGRLQIPIVKLAILDKSFFEMTSHPARALLNELSSAGIGWSSAQELKRDALYDKIESIVLRVLNEFADNPALFNELLHELREFVSKDARRSVLVEQRVKEAETGKAKTHAAKLKVQTLINSKAVGLRLPSEAGRFISEDWSRVLTLFCVRFGETSQEWTNAVSTLDNFLWSLQPLSDLEDVTRRDELVNELVDNITRGMDAIGCSEDEIAQLTDWLIAHVHQLSNNDRGFLEEDAEAHLTVPVTTVEEIILATPVEEPKPIEPELSDRIKAITEGTWVEITRKDDVPLRCKLATVTQPGDNYIFVNRRGMKVLEQTRVELATLVEQERLNVIDESQVFDRALQSVIGNLRKMQQGRPET